MNELPDHARPTATSLRIATLDVLRGFALLGILLMNIQSFAMVGPAYLNPTAFGDFEGTNYLVWHLSHLLADTKFISLFSILFGAGIVLFADRQESKGIAAWPLHRRRMGWLFLIGLAHAYLIWQGDVLVAYSICGIALFPARKWTPRTQSVVGLAMVGVASALYLLVGLSMPYWSEQDIQELSTEWILTPDQIETRIAVWQDGPWTGQLPYRARAAFTMQTFLFAVFTFWRSGGCMLLGMALYRLEVLTGKRSPGTYATLAILGLGIGLPVISWGIHRNFAVDWDIRYSFFTGSQFNYWGSLSVAGGYIGLVGLLSNSRLMATPLKWLANVGRMALTNYICQSLLCSFIFYGHGLGMYGATSRTLQFGVVVAIWLVQLILSSWWLSRFRFGPLEWLWRCLSYRAWQPLTRGT